MNDFDLNQRLCLQQQVTSLYILLGQAIWAIQHLEDALSASIAMKNPGAINKIMGNKIRDSNRKLTLGEAVGRAREQNAYEDVLQKKLENFLSSRNWLVHKCMRESVDDIGMVIDEAALFGKINDIHLSAISLREAIENDMYEFLSSKGRSDIRESVMNEMAKWQKKYGLSGESR